MKKSIWLPIMMLFLLLCSTEIQAQSFDLKPDQKELFNRYIKGTFKSELAKDTFHIFEARPYGPGYDCNFWYQANGVNYQEGRSLIGYDQKLDKFIQVELYQDGNIDLFALWFSSNNLCKCVPLDYLENPEKAPMKFELEYLSPDECTFTFIKHNKPDKIVTYYRVK